jgi:hypothetical protein
MNFIAQLTKDGKPLAVLGDEGKWTSPQEDVAAHLNQSFSPHDIGGLGAVLPFGHYAAALAGRKLQAEVEYSRPSSPAPHGLIS